MSVGRHNKLSRSAAAERTDPAQARRRRREREREKEREREYITGGPDRGPVTDIPSSYVGGNKPRLSWRLSR